MSKHGKLILGVLASGSGTNLQAIIDACEAGDIDARVVVVISDKGDSYALERAKKSSIPAVFVDFKRHVDRKTFEAEIAGVLQKHGVGLVCLAGYMRIVGKTLLRAYPNRIINIHPALLPSFPGLDGQKQAFEYGVKVAGCTVHFVDEKTDHGPIICQAAVEVRERDTLETLRDRILENEHRIYPKAIQMIAEGRVKIIGRRVLIKGRE